MPFNTFRAFYLGTITDLDPNESNYSSEAASSLVGLTFGGPDNALVDTALVDLTTEDADGDGAVWDNDNRLRADTISSSEGSDRLDSTNEYFVTLTYTDGTTASTAVTVLQDEGGRAYLTTFGTGSAFNAISGAKPIESLTIDSVKATNYSGVIASDRTDGFITCYAAGTLIDCETGPRAIEDLRIADMVATQDCGLQPVLYICRSRTRAVARGAYVQVMPDALAAGRPSRVLKVSRQHRMLLQGGRKHGAGDVMVPAGKLTALEGIHLCATGEPIEYYHLLLPGHFVISANDALSESLFLGPMVRRDPAYAGACAAARNHGCANPKPARPFVDGKQAFRLAESIAAEQRADGQAHYARRQQNLAS